MEVEEIELSQIRKKLVVEVPSEQVKSEYDRIESEIHRNAAIAGFRKGRVPIEIVRKRFADTISKEAVQNLIRDSLSNVLDEKNLKPVGQPELTNVKSEYGSALRYEVELEVMPALHVDNYRQIPLKKELIAVTDEDVEQRLLDLRKRAAEFRPVDVPATESYWVVADIEGTIDGTGQKIVEEKGALLSLGPDSPEPRLSEQLIGSRAGETRELSITFDKEDDSPAVRGKTVLHRVKINEVKEQILAPLDDDFATTLGEYSSLDELRDRIRQDVVREKDLVVRKKYAGQIMDYLNTAYPVEIPSAFYHEYALQNTIAYKQYLERSGKKVENLEDEIQKAFSHYATEASSFTRASLILEEIARAESLAVSDEEIDEKLRRLAEEGHKSFEGMKAKLGEKGHEQMKSNLLKDKVIDFLIAEARID